MPANLDSSWTDPKVDSFTPIRQRPAPAPTAAPAFTVNGLDAAGLAKLRAAQAATAAIPASDLTAVQKAGAEALKKRVAEIRADKGLSDVGVNQAFTDFADSPEMQAALQAPEAARAKRQEAKDAIRQVKRSLKVETQAGDRAVRRNEARLANTENVVQETRSMLAQAEDQEQIAAVLEAVNGTLAARGGSTEADWLDAELAELIPELAAAIRAERQAARVETVVLHNNSRLTTAVQERRPLAVPLNDA